MHTLGGLRVVQTRVLFRSRAAAHCSKATDPENSRYDRIRPFQETRIHPCRTKSSTDLRHDVRSLGPGYLINPQEPSCTDYGPYPHADCRGFSVSGFRDRTEVV